MNAGGSEIACGTTATCLARRIGSSKWKSWSRGNPLADPELAKLEREFVTTEDEAALDRFCAPGHTPAPAYSDPRYPYRGRIARLDAEPA